MFPGIEKKFGREFQSCRNTLKKSTCIQNNQLIRFRWNELNFFYGKPFLASSKWFVSFYFRFVLPEEVIKIPSIGCL